MRQVGPVITQTMTVATTLETIGRTSSYGCWVGRLGRAEVAAWAVSIRFTKSPIPDKNLFLTESAKSNPVFSTFGVRSSTDIAHRPGKTRDLWRL